MEDYCCDCVTKYTLEICVNWSFMRHRRHRKSVCICIYRYRMSNVQFTKIGSQREHFCWHCVNSIPTNFRFESLEVFPVNSNWSLWAFGFWWIHHILSLWMYVCVCVLFIFPILRSSSIAQHTHAHAPCIHSNFEQFNTS